MDSKSWILEFRQYHQIRLQKWVSNRKNDVPSPVDFWGRIYWNSRREIQKFKRFKSIAIKFESNHCNDLNGGKFAHLPRKLCSRRLVRGLWGVITGQVWPLVVILAHFCGHSCVRILQRARNTSFLPLLSLRNPSNYENPPKSFRSII